MAGSLVDRMMGAAFLNVATYEEVEHDETATGQAAAVVAMVAVATAIGGWNFGISAVVGGAVTALVKWLMWAGITYLVGTMLFGGTATWGELLRTLGFAQAPGILAVLAIIPVLGWFVLPGHQQRKDLPDGPGGLPRQHGALRHLARQPLSPVRGAGRATGPAPCRVP
jgi:cytochrome bd-type quinol oxidase subunit 2